MRSVIVSLVVLLGLILPTFSSAVTLETARYLPHTAGNQWSYINDNYNTMTNNFGSPVTLPSGMVAIPWTRVDSNTCISSCVTYNTFDANGWLRYQEYIGSVYISGYGNTSATSVFAPALSFAPANVTIGSTYTSTGAVTITYTNVTTVSLNYSSTTQIVGFETVSNNAGTQLWSALKVIISTTMSGTVNGQFLTITSASTYWLVDGLGMVKAYAPNASGVMETWNLTSTNVEIPKGSQTIGTISFSPTSLVVGGTTTANASATSGLTISFSSTNPSICTVSGSTVTGIAVGACTIAANQVGDANYNAATQVTQTITIGAVSNVASYMGLWYNPNESGWGMSVTQHDNINFVALYTYDQSAQPVWYVMSDCRIATAGSCSGDIYQVIGGTSPTQPWVALDFAQALSTAGSGTLTFSDNNNGKFDFTLNGVTGSKSIERQMFSSGTAAQALDYTDLWWNASESGWGVALTQDVGMIFAAWYTYDAAGLPVWYVASSCPLSGSGCTGDVYKVTGGEALTAAWNGINPVATVGTVSFAFSDSSTGTMSYTIDGVTGSRAISRQPF